MPVVPITKGTQSQPQAMPSETNMLMAIADMHKQGRFTSPEFIQPLKPGESGTPAQITETAKRVGEKDPSQAIRRTIQKTHPGITDDGIDALLSAQPGS